jgi:hypothetical protein
VHHLHGLLVCFVQNIKMTRAIIGSVVTENKGVSEQRLVTQVGRSSDHIAVPTEGFQLMAQCQADIAGNPSDFIPQGSST